jgi:serpin B
LRFRQYTFFALNLYAKLKEEKGDLYYFPFSISTALTMTYADAPENSAKQMD